MSSDKQIEANRRNALKSTGPRTVEGKAVVSRNALRHGLTAQSAAVVPLFEKEEDWEAHRRGTLESLRPEGHLETVLAERVAVQLWRLARVTRYERALLTEEVTRAEEQIADEILKASSLDEERDWIEANEYRMSLLEQFPKMADDRRVEGNDAAWIIWAVEEVCERFDIRQEGVPYASSADEIHHYTGWTAGRVREVITAMAARERKTAEALLDAAARTAENDKEKGEWRVREYKSALQRAKLKRVLTLSQIEDTIPRYEAHIDRGLYKALHELQRLQAARRGDAVPAPGVVDVDVTGVSDGG